ncbi:MAG: hypothetical protein LPH21_16600 [Shewanella sp.]|nr:hypothetical protein [Shewanella sp.]MCF1430304.1 hypothetical protein [Shewanella sp.]MCF1459095.1 hypothetical protein [Shewanella sp.]
MDDLSTEDELREAVWTYVDMRSKEDADQPFVKVDYYRELAEQFPK